MDIPDELSTKRIMSFKATGGRTTTYGRLHPDFPAYTINTYFNRPNVGANYHHREERLITVREALRLQSFPDHFHHIILIKEAYICRLAMLFHLLWLRQLRTP